MAGGFHLDGLFEGFQSSAPSTITGGDACEYRAHAMGDTQRKNHVKFTKKICELKIHANFGEF
jgi:hypothetical protein